MKIKAITDHISVATQITVDDVKTISQLGFKSIICNRPDGEDPQQTDFHLIKQAAKKYSLTTCFFPVINTSVYNKDKAEKFAELLTQLPQPVLAYCHSGKRSVVLWSLSQTSHMCRSEILEKTQKAGYQVAVI